VAASGRGGNDWHLTVCPPLVDSDPLAEASPKTKPPPLRAGACKLQSEFSPRPEENRSEIYCDGAVVVFAALVFFVFVAFVFFIFVAFVVSCAPVSCANTGMANEKAIIPVNSSVRSFFMLGLDLLRDYFLFPLSNAWAIFVRPHRVWPIC